MTIIDSPDVKGAKRLTDQLQSVMSGQNINSIACSAFMQSHLANTALVGLMKLLVHKNIISDAEVVKALAAAYNDRAQRFTNENVILLPPAPTLRNGN